jgi:hypothetical protein
MELNIRKLKQEDWGTLTKLWNMWPEWKDKFPTKELLPENGTGGYIVEKNNIPVIAGFLYTTNSKVAWIEWIVSNKDYREDDRKQALELLINGIEHVAISSGFNIILSIARNKGLINAFKDLKYTVDDKPSFEISKKIN